MKAAGVRIAMWSGPRNVSTAMMRAWEARGDTAVADEPFYACYLAATGARHPGRERILAECETDWSKVVERITGPVPGGQAIYFQKHMAHHLLPDAGRAWLTRLRHALLVRDPAAMVVSLDRVTPDPGLEDTGLPQQCEIFDEVGRLTGAAPPVLDADDLLRAPPAQLGALCEALGVPYTTRMLSWTAGRRSTDGVWAEHWYADVEGSTGFRPHRARRVEVPTRLRPLVEACRPLYDRLHAARIVTP